MSEEVVQISTDIEPTNVRFGLRSMLFAMLLAGIAAAAIAPSFRAIATENLWIAGALWGLFFSITPLRIIRLAHKRHQLETEAGGLLVASHWRGTYTGHGWTFASFVVGLLLLAMGITSLIWAHGVIESSHAPMLIAIVASAFIAAYCVSNGIALVWWHRTAQFRENGFFYGLRLLPWNQVDSVALLHSMLKLRGTDTRGAKFYLIMHVPAEQRAAIRAVLSAKLPNLLPVEMPITIEQLRDGGCEEREPVIREIIPRQEDGTRE